MGGEILFCLCICGGVAEGDGAVGGEDVESGEGADSVDSIAVDSAVG